MSCDRAIISRSDGATQAKIGRVFFRLQIRLAFVDGNHVMLKGRLGMVILLLFVR
jgi:hypothetical protein